jgi:hypothetical protein
LNGKPTGGFFPDSFFSSRRERIIFGAAQVSNVWSFFTHFVRYGLLVGWSFGRLEIYQKTK